MSEQRTIEKRVCPECDGTGQIEVNVEDERFRKQLRFFVTMICTVGLAGYCLVKLYNGHVDVFGWVVLIGFAVMLRDTYREMPS